MRGRTCEGCIERSALVTGAGGQDGSYLAELAARRGYEVVGASAIAADVDSARRVELRGRPARQARCATLREHGSEVYNLASPSFVPRSWEHPVETAEFAAVGVTSLLEAIRDRRRRRSGSTRRRRARSSASPSRRRRAESTPFRPCRRTASRRRTALHRRRVPEQVRAARELGDPLQPRVAATVGRLPPAQGRARRRRDRRGSRARARARRPRRAARLGLCARLRRGDVADAAAGRARRLRDRDRRAAQRAASSSRSPSRTSGSTGARTCASTSRSCAGRELHHLVGDASKARAQLGWKPTVTFEQLVALLVDAACAA